ncbi:MAG TPA: HAD-IA family hydrolase [Gammaproteobacteria bacterium]|nr:HAD-IA family hydrolase [Gammaproteobacteria bacterium]
MSVKLVLFDLDGTLLDTAPDLGGALNSLRAEYNLNPLSHDMIRPVVSHGAPALLKLGLGILPNDSRYASIRIRLLELYAARLSRETKYFPGMEKLLRKLERRKLAWGVVTNKPSHLTDPLLRDFDLYPRAACVVSGDTTPRRKPYPDPLLYASDLCYIAPAECVYFGDAERDVQAARAAGMAAVVALYGYIESSETPETWGADALLQKPLDLLDWLDRAPTTAQPHTEKVNA